MSVELIKLKEELIGKTITDVYYTGLNSACIMLTFEDGSELNIGAEGDDMAHTVISLATDNGIEIINL